MAIITAYCTNKGTAKEVNQDALLIKTRKMAMSRYLIEDEIVGIRPMEEAYKNIYYTMAKSRSVLGNNYDMVFPMLWEQIQNKDVILYVIELKTTGDVCGFCQLDMDDPTHPEFGIDMLTEYMGNGYGKQAIKLLYALVREWNNVEYFVWKADVDNIASQKIAESIGAVLMQEHTLLPQSMIDMGKEQGLLTSRMLHFRLYEQGCCKIHSHGQQ